MSPAASVQLFDACSTPFARLPQYAAMHSAIRHIESCQPQPPTQPILVSKKGSAALLSVCPRTVDNLIATKQLPCRRIGRRVLIPYTPSSPSHGVTIRLRPRLRRQGE
jgi:hypothetical protein